ncbi:hypothetical protein LNT41_26455, partial [Klebsiella pneumoniae]|nr:hypothetical protein [Klebsiella pneumoniae]
MFTEQETTLHSQKSQDDPYTFCILSTHQKWSQTVSPVMNITVWLIKGHCCKVSDEAAFCLIQRPYISKTLL